MDAGRLVVSLGWTYVLSLIIVAAITLLWIATSTTGGSPTVAGLWFAVAGFGVLVIVIVALVEASRR